MKKYTLNHPKVITSIDKYVNSLISKIANEGMNEEVWKKNVKALKGKKVGSDTYFHVDYLEGSNNPVAEFLKEKKQELGLGDEFNIIRVARNDFNASFSEYPNFMTDPHPSLERTIRLDFEKGTKKENTFGGANPPILHRKEHFIPGGNAEFEAMTKAEESVGLYENTRIIGRKKKWEELLDEKGVYHDGHILKRKEDGSKVMSSLKVKAELNMGMFQTPIYFEGDPETDSKASSMRSGTPPSKDLLRVFKSISPIKPDGSPVTVLDYGAGREGRNAEALREMGFKVYGYDYSHSHGSGGWTGVSTKKPVGVKFDYCMCVFVLNVVTKEIEKEIVKDLKRFSKNIVVMVRQFGGNDLGTSAEKGIKRGKGITYDWFVDKYLPARGLSIEDVFDEEGNVPQELVLDFARFGFLTKGPFGVSFQRATFPKEYGFSKKGKIYTLGSF